MSTGSSKAGTAGTTAVDKFFILVKNALYETVFLCAKDTRVSTWWFVVTVVVDALQLLIFPAQLIIQVSDETIAFRSIVESFLSWISLSDSAFLSLDNGFWLFIFVTSFAWVLGYVSIFIFIGYRFSVGAAQSGALLKLLRAVALLSSTVLFLPFLSVLLQAFQCISGEWAVHSLPCYRGGHIPILAASSILIPCFILLSVFMSAIFFDRDIRSKIASAQTNGRGDVLMLANKIVLSITFGPFLESLDPWLLQFFLLCSSVSYLTVYLSRMPYVWFTINDLRTALASGYFLATIASLIAVIDESFDASILLLVGIPLACALGFVVSRLRHRVIASKRLDELRGANELSIWARKRIYMYELLKDEYNTERTQHSKWGQRQTGVGGSTFSAMMHHVQKKAVEQVEDDGPLHSGPEAENEEPDASLSDPRLFQLGYSIFAIGSLDSIKEDIELAYRTMLDKFPSNGTGILEAATYFRHYHNNLYMELTTLNLAKKHSQAWDIHFVVYQRLRSLREGNHDSTSRVSQMNAIDRVMFDQEWSTAANKETTIYKIIYQLWQALLAPSPDLYQLQRYGEDLTSALRSAEHHYRTCLRLNPDSPLALRGYGIFLNNVKGQKEQANEYLNKAERVEDSVGKNKTRRLHRFLFNQRMADINYNDESTAVITISGDASRLGEITEANAAASRLFGKSKHELVASNVNTIIPRPFSDVHDQYLRRFARSGRSVVLNTTRSLFGITGTGAMIPLIMKFRETPAGSEDADSSPRFSAVMHSPQTDEHFVIFDDAKKGFQILHADSTSLSFLLGLNAEHLGENEISMGDFIPFLRQTEHYQDFGSESGWKDDESTRKISHLRAPSLGRINDETWNQTKRQLHKTNSGAFTETSMARVNEKAEDYLNGLSKSSQHINLKVENAADPSAAQILARVQRIPVTDYGKVYLLAWKFDIPQKNKRKSTAAGKGDHIRTFNVSSGQCPVKHNPRGSFEPNISGNGYRNDQGGNTRSGEFQQKQAHSSNDRGSCSGQEHDAQTKTKPIDHEVTANNATENLPGIWGSPAVTIDGATRTSASTVENNEVTSSYTTQASTSTLQSPQHGTSQHLTVSQEQLDTNNDNNTADNTIQPSNTTQSTSRYQESSRVEDQMKQSSPTVSETASEHIAENQDQTNNDTQNFDPNQTRTHPGNFFEVESQPSQTSFTVSETTGEDIAGNNVPIQPEPPTTITPLNASKHVSSSGRNNRRNRTANDTASSIQSCLKEFGNMNRQISDDDSDEPETGGLPSTHPSATQSEVVQHTEETMVSESAMDTDDIDTLEHKEYFEEVSKANTSAPASQAATNAPVATSSVARIRRNARQRSTASSIQSCLKEFGSLNCEVLDDHVNGQDSGDLNSTQPSVTLPGIPQNEEETEDVQKPIMTASNASEVKESLEELVKSTTFASPTTQSNTTPQVSNSPAINRRRRPSADVTPSIQSCLQEFGNLNRKTGEDDESASYSTQTYRNQTVNAQPKTQQMESVMDEDKAGSTGSHGSSVSRLLRHIIYSNSTALNPSVNKMRILAFSVSVIFVILAIVAWIVVELYMDESMLNVDNVKYGASRFVSSLHVESSLYQVHISNSEVAGTVGPISGVWSVFQGNVNNFIDETRGARSQAEEVGGKSRSYDRNAIHEKVNRFNEETSTLSANELRDEMLSRLRSILDERNASTLRPGDTTSDAVIFFDNSETMVGAFNESLRIRQEQLHDLTISFRDNIAAILFTLFCVVNVVAGFFYWYNLRQLDRLKKRVLKTFLLLPASVIQGLRDLAASSLRSHLERVSKVELSGMESDSESDEDSFSLNSEHVEEETLESREDNSFLQPRKTASGKRGNNSYGPSSRVVPADSVNRSKSRKASLASSYRMNRDFRDSEKFMFSSLLRVTSPLLIFSAWIIFAFVNASHTLTGIREQSDRLVVIEQVVSDWITYEQSLRHIFYRVPYPEVEFGSASTSQLREFRSNALEARQATLFRLSVLLEGGPVESGRTVSAFPRDRLGFDLLASNGCIAGRISDPQKCETTSLGSGIVAFSLGYLNLGLQILAHLPSFSMNNENALDMVRSNKQLQAQMLTFNEALYPFAFQVMNELVEESVDIADGEVDDALFWQQIATTVCVISFIIVSGFVAIPVMRSLGQTVVSSFHLLILFPEDIVSSHRALKKQMRELANEISTSQEDTDAAMLLATTAKHQSQQE